MSRKDLIKEISFESSKSIIGGIGGKILDYVLIVLLARYLQPSGFGVYATGFMIASVMVTTSQLGLKSGMTRFVSKAIGEARENDVAGIYLIIVAISVASSGFFLLAGTAFLEKISAIFFDTDRTFLVFIFILSVPFRTVLTVSLSLFNGYNDMGTRVGIELTRDSLQLLVAAAVIFLGVSIESLVLGLVSVLAFTCLASVSLSIRKLSDADFNFKPYEVLGVSRRVLSYSLPLWLVAIANLGMNWADILLLSYFSNSTVVGLYQSAYSLSSGFWVLLLAFSTPFFAMSSRLYTDSNFDQLEKLFQLVTRWINLLMIPVFVFTLVFAFPIISLMFGNSYAGGAVILQLLLVGSMIHTASGNNVVILKSTDRTRVYLWISLSSLILNIILNIFLIQSFGGPGAAIATTTTMGLLNFSTIAYVYYEFGIWGYAPYNIYLTYVVSSITALIPIFVVNKYADPNIIALSLIYAFLYFLLIGIQDGYTDIDREVVKLGTKRILN